MRQHPNLSLSWTSLTWIGRCPSMSRCWVLALLPVPEQRFAYLVRDGIHLMLEEAAGPGRRFHLAPLEYPFGRGMNLQIEVSDVDALYASVQQADLSIVVPLEERWYRRNQTEVGTGSSSWPIRTAICFDFSATWVGDRPRRQPVAWEREPSLGHALLAKRDRRQPPTGIELLGCRPASTPLL